MTGRPVLSSTSFSSRSTLGRLRWAGAVPDFVSGPRDRVELDPSVFLPKALMAMTSLVLNRAAFIPDDSLGIELPE
jgi:hypothetical protein